MEDKAGIHKRFWRDKTVSRRLYVGILPENLGLRANISTRSSDKHVDLLLKDPSTVSSSWPGMCVYPES